LRLSKDYWLICQSAQRKSDLVVEPKTRDATLASMYRRFGDIHSMSFEAWWEARGYRVFAEQQTFPKVTLVASAPRERSRQAPPPEHIWVEIPLKLSARTIKRQIGVVLSEHAEQRLADRRLLSSAAYKLSPSRLNLHTLQRLHEVYCLHRELIAKPMALNRTHGIKRHRADYAQRADLFRIGKLLRISPSNESLIGTPQQISRVFRRSSAKRTKHLRLRGGHWICAPNLVPPSSMRCEPFTIKKPNAPGSRLKAQGSAA
jgi:hypothetical protein